MKIWLLTTSILLYFPLGAALDIYEGGGNISNVGDLISTIHIFRYAIDDDAVFRHRKI